jgi:hypothetical protein
MSNAIAHCAGTDNRNKNHDLKNLSDFKENDCVANVNASSIKAE